MVCDGIRRRVAGADGRSLQRGAATDIPTAINIPAITIPVSDISVSDIHIADIRIADIPVPTDSFRAAGSLCPGIPVVFWKPDLYTGRQPADTGRRLPGSHAFL